MFNEILIQIISFQVQYFLTFYNLFLSYSCGLIGLSSNNLEVSLSQEKWEYQSPKPSNVILEIGLCKGHIFMYWHIQDQNAFYMYLSLSF